MKRLVLAVSLVFTLFVISGCTSKNVGRNLSVNAETVGGNESLLYSTAESIEIYKLENGLYPETLEQLYSFNKDLFSNKNPYYKVSVDGQSFELIGTGPDGEFNTIDDVKYDPARRASNLLPMYGGKDAVKTPFQIEADQKFIDSALKMAGNREKGAIEISEVAWQYFNNGDLETAIKRFNQVWLLNPNNPESYKGFAAILEKQGKSSQAREMLNEVQGLSQ